jgi:hypothetical protein
MAGSTRRKALLGAVTANLGKPGLSVVTAASFT